LITVHPNALPIVWKSPPDPISLKMISVGGNIPCTHIFPVNWVIEDDHGHKHLFNIPGTIYAPPPPHCLLSPQHWSHAANDNIPNPNGTWCGTYADHVQLHWSQCQFTRTVPLHVSTNTATLYTAAGFTVATALCKDLINFTPPAYSHLIPSEEREFLQPQKAEEVENTRLTDLEPDLEMPTTSSPFLPEGAENHAATTIPPEWLEMQFQDPSPLIEGEPGHIPSNQALWTYWHQRLGHLSKICMRAMAKDGRLPKQLATCEVPLCPSCIAGKSTQRPWGAKRDTTKKANTISSPGQVIYVDQLESPTPGFMGQIKSPRLTITVIVSPPFLLILSVTSLSFVTRLLPITYSPYCSQPGISAQHRF
jgi:hypothetical protein